MKIYYGLLALLGSSVNGVLASINTLNATTELNTTACSNNATVNATTELNTTACSNNATVQANVSIQAFAAAVSSTHKTTSTSKKTSSTSQKSTTSTKKPTTTAKTTTKKPATSTTTKKPTSTTTKKTSTTTKKTSTSTKPTTTAKPTTTTKSSTTTKPTTTTKSTSTTAKSSTTTTTKPTTTTTTTTKPTITSTSTSTSSTTTTTSTSTTSTTSSTASPTSSYICSPPSNADISPWVGCTNGTLTYGTFGPGNDSIPDFSNVGYKGGAIPIPSPAVQVTLSPSSSGDDTVAVQNALNQVGQLSVGSDGFRGAVLLLPGTFTFSNYLYMSNSGVVLRGSGTDQTLLNLTLVLNSTSVNNSFIAADSGAYYKFSNRNTTIMDQYVPVHTTLLNVTDASKLVVGDTVLVQRKITSDWVDFMGMQNLQKLANGTSVSWYQPNSTRSVSTQERTIIGILNNTLQLDIPLTDPFNATLDGNSTVNAFTFPSRLTNIGIESLSAIAPPSQTGQDITSGLWIFAYFGSVADSWIQNVNVTNFDNGLCDMDHLSTRLTIQDIDIQHGVPLNLTQGHALELSQRGQQSLYQRIRDTGYSIYFHATQSYTNGPNVLRDCVFNAPSGTAATSFVAPHNRFATGALFENITFTNGGIQIINRKADGLGQGWSAAWSVGWNSVGSTFQIYTPPGSTNWCIGCQGPHAGNGTFYSSTASVWPQSLYLEQLKARLGQNATPT